jgi:hypothetical protein
MTVVSVGMAGKVGDSRRRVNRRCSAEPRRRGDAALQQCRARLQLQGICRPRPPSPTAQRWLLSLLLSQSSAEWLISLCPFVILALF